MAVPPWRAGYWNRPRQVEWKPARIWRGGAWDARNAMIGQGASDAMKERVLLEDTSFAAYPAACAGPPKYHFRRTYHVVLGDRSAPQAVNREFAAATSSCGGKSARIGPTCARFWQTCRRG